MIDKVKFREPQAVVQKRRAVDTDPACAVIVMGKAELTMAGLRRADRLRAYLTGKETNHDRQGKV